MQLRRVFPYALSGNRLPQERFRSSDKQYRPGRSNYRERKKTGSLYGLRNIYKQFMPDEEWFKISIAVRGKNVQIRLKGLLVVDYVEPTPPVIPDGPERERFLDHGTFALQCHNEGSRAFFRSVRVRPLPDDVTSSDQAAPVADKSIAKSSMSAATTFLWSISTYI